MDKKSFELPKLDNYKPILDLMETEIAIKKVKDFFEAELAKELNLTRVSAPLFVRPETGLNDNLNGVERPVSFDVLFDKNTVCEVVQSLAKWKRMALKRYNFPKGKGLYTDMNAIRRDEIPDNLHSLYVDQWDWEKVIDKSERNEETLKNVVKKIFNVFKRTEDYLYSIYPQLGKILPDDIFFITTQELEDRYPELTPRQREDAIAKEKGAVFVMKIGGKLKSGIKHDGRSPDYDDWELNGDIIYYYPVMDIAFEVSSMGIRVDEDTLVKQLKEEGCEERLKMDFHKDLVEKRLPYTIGGGIGQSRICMLFLRKVHIGEVQASIWPQEMIEECQRKSIELL